MFDHIIYINLDRRPDRDANVRKIIKENNLQSITTRLSAVDGSKLDLTKLSGIITDKGVVDAKTKNLKTGIPLTIGAIGCAMSHMECWKMIIRQKTPRALILEDDIEVAPGFRHRLNTYSSQIPDNFDVLFLGYHPASLKYINSIPINSVEPIVVTSNKVYGLFGYIVSYEGAHKLMKMFPITQQIDTEMSHAFKKYNIKAYLLRPELRLIESEPSEDAKKFGTDIQSRESFGTTTLMDDLFNIVIIICVVVILITLVRVLVEMKVGPDV